MILLNLLRYDDFFEGLLVKWSVGQLVDSLSGYTVWSIGIVFGQSLSFLSPATAGRQTLCHK